MLRALRYTTFMNTSTAIAAWCRHITNSQMMAMADGGGQRENNVLLANCFEIKSKRHRVTLTPQFVFWEPEGCPDFRQQLPLNEIIAIKPVEWTRSSYCCPCLQNGDERHVRAKELISFHVTALQLNFIERGWKHRWKLRSLVFHNPNSLVVHNWITTVNDILSGFTNRPKRLLIFINPFGGKKKALKIYDRQIRPLFELASVDTQVIVTERANHARDFLQDVCLSKLDGLIAVGGDGMFSELLNGLLIRTQKEAGLNVNNYQLQPVRPEIRLGIIPAGSTDAMVYSTTGTNDPVTSALHIIIGDNVAVDVCGVFHEQHFLRYATSMVAYGYFGDIIVDSEKNRWLGPYRYDWSGFKKVLKNRAYDGELLFKVHPKAESSPLDKTKCRAGCRTCERAREKFILANSDEQSSYNGWNCIRGRFIGVNTVALSCACGLAKQGVSPSAHLGDGCTDVIVVQKCSRFQYARFLLRTAFRHDDPFSLNFVQVHRVREFQFRPTFTQDFDDDSVSTVDFTRPRHTHLKSSVWSCDGELLDQPSVNVKVYCQLVKLFARGVEADIFDADCRGSLSKKQNLTVGAN